MVDRDPETLTRMMREAQEYEAKRRRERIVEGDLPEGEECPYCGEVVDRDNLHLTCF